jgi:hypothetical protein
MVISSPNNFLRIENTGNQSFSARVMRIDWNSRGTGSDPCFLRLEVELEYLISSRLVVGMEFSTVRGN